MDACDLGTEFPDYPLDSLPEIPGWLKGSHWHNEQCPSWRYEHDGRFLQLFVDYPKPETREHPESKRFTVNVGRQDGGELTLDDVLHTDDWNDVMRHLLIGRWALRMALGFHPDTEGADYVDANGAASLTDDEATEYYNDIARARRLGDPYDASIAIWKALGLVDWHSSPKPEASPKA
jgi:hypothetical protein